MNGFLYENFLDRSVYVILANTYDEFFDELSTLFKRDITKVERENLKLDFDEISSCKGQTVLTDSGHIIIWIIENHENKILTLLHEIVHASFFIFTDIDIKLNRETDEVFARLIEDLFNKACVALFPIVKKLFL